ncbi:MAG: carboxypeptidase regulatory-like domain-containing protein [Pirellulaceae bacterium]|nr:carboxypeptidase regulatory-like domain-containing protein [Pirellulaceae bacterium]
MAAAGCGEQRPEGFPTLYPATITITQDGANLAGATVSLFPEDSTLSRWPVGGMTDENGMARLITYGKFEGAPAGKFKVMVNKTVSEGDPIPEVPGQYASAEERAAYDRAIKTGSYEVFQVVAGEYRTADKTPLMVEIAPSGENAIVLDVGAAVKEEDIQASATQGGEYVPMGEAK